MGDTGQLDMTKRDTADRPAPPDTDGTADTPGTDLARRHNVLDGEIVSLPDRPPVDLQLRPAVSQPKPWTVPDELPPIVAGWLRDADERATAVRWWLRVQAHRVKWHGVRLPRYCLLCLAYTPRGIVRFHQRVRDQLDEGRPLRRAARERGDDATYLKLLAEHKKAKRERRITTIGFAVLAMAALIAASLFAPWWAWIPAGTVAVTYLGRLGQKPDSPIFAPAIQPGGARTLSPGVVVRAFEAAKLCSESDPLSFATPIHRDANGWRVVLDLPFGGTADKAIEARDKVASGLDVDERQVFLSRVRGASGSARRVDMWVCDVDPLSISAGPSELIGRKHINFWEPWPFGKNERGATVDLCVLWAAMLIGSIPRRGKTFVARLVALAAALDPHVKLYIFDQKGSPDWTPFEHVADRIFYGERADPDTGVHPLAALVDTVNDLLAEVDRRNRVLRQLPKDICPEGKLTEELSRTKSLGMELIVLVIDEVHRGFANKDYKDDLEQGLTELAKVGPSTGIITVSATQKPDAKSAPTGWRDQFGIRFAMYVTTRDASEAVLGAGAGGEGMHAHKLSPEALGAGILRGTGDAAIRGGIVRTGYADGRDAEEICLRGRKLREDAGTLSGMALGHIVSATPFTYSIVKDLAVVMGARDKAHSDVLCSYLSDRWPERYAGWTPMQLQSALKPHDVRPRQVWAESLEDQVPRNRQGFLRADVTEALYD
jgi:S-DNA-T family DNA segregation ATPase FtsK/SpoIIIE